MTQSAALELARFKIRVNAVFPGVIDTPMNAPNPPGMNDVLVKTTPLRRMGESREVAEAVLFSPHLRQVSPPVLNLQLMAACRSRDGVLVALGSDTAPLTAQLRGGRTRRQHPSDDIRLLGRLLGDVVREQAGDETFNLIENVRRLAVDGRRTDSSSIEDLTTELQSVDIDDALHVIRAFLARSAREYC